MEPIEEKNIPAVQPETIGHARENELAEQLLAEMETAQGLRGGVLRTRRREAENVRFARWPGQSPDGRKRREQLQEEPFPFEGASDNRIRLADSIICERVRMRMAASVRQRIQVRPTSLAKAKQGGAMRTLLRWVLVNELGGEWRRELKRLANWVDADVPAAAVLGVYWRRERTLQWEELDLAQSLEAMAAEMAEAGMEEAQIIAAVEEVRDMVENVARQPEAVDMLAQLYPTVAKDRLVQVVEDLRMEGRARFPRSFFGVNRPALCAHRLYEDILIAGEPDCMDRARAVFVREWVSEVELRERSGTYGWRRKWVDEVLKRKGQSSWDALDEADGFEAAGDGSVARDNSLRERRQMFEVLTAYYRAVDEEGSIQIWMVQFHGMVKGLAAAPQPLGYKHGKYPFVFFARETLTRRITDSRSISEIVLTDQNQLKILDDSFSDHVQLSTVPPVRVPHNRPRVKLVIGPLQEVRERRQGEVAWMAPPAYPQTNQIQQETLRQRVAEYFGRPVEGVAPALSSLAMQELVDDWLDGLKEALDMMLQLCQQYYTDEDIARITNTQGQPIFRSVEEIQGKYDLELTMDARDLDFEWLIKKAQLLEQVLRFDTGATVQRHEILQAMFLSLDPGLAEVALMPPQEASEAEARDEQDNLVRILAGIEPPMMEEGQDFGARLSELQKWLQLNPEIQQKLTPISAKMLEARVSHLQNQVQQLRNAQIGRQVGQPVLEGGV